MPSTPPVVRQLYLQDSAFGSAQLTPDKFYRVMLEAAEARGAVLHTGSAVVGLVWDGTRAAGCTGCPAVCPHHCSIV